MPPYKIFFTPTSLKEFKKLDKIVQKKINKALLALGENPFATNVDVLVNHPEARYRRRVGDWRILFNTGAEKTINVIHIWPRGKDYKK